MRQIQFAFSKIFYSEDNNIKSLCERGRRETDKDHHHPGYIFSDEEIFLDED